MSASDGKGLSVLGGGTARGRRVPELFPRTIVLWRDPFLPAIIKNISKSAHELPYRSRRLPPRCHVLGSPTTPPTPALALGLHTAQPEKGPGAAAGAARGPGTTAATTPDRRPSPGHPGPGPG